MHTLIMERLITSKQDMDEVEDEIRRQLLTDLNRCSFLRSLAYIKLRIAALYATNSSPHSAFCGNLSVSLIPTKEGPHLTLKWLDKVVYEQDKFCRHREKKRRADDDGI